MAYARQDGVVVGGWAAHRFVVALAVALLAVCTPLHAAPGKTDPAIVNVFRFFNTSTGVHFYTADPVERQYVIDHYKNLVDEGAVYRALGSSTAGAIPVYRFYNRITGAHFYTADPVERQRVLSTLPQFSDEGVVFYAYADDAIDHVAVHRFYNVQTQTHFFTASESERDYVAHTYPQFVYEGIAWYALPLAPGAEVAARRDAFRLLDQATMGPTPADVDNVVRMGAAAWLEDQLNQPASGYPDPLFWYVSLDESPTCKFSAPRTSATYACARDQLTLFNLRRQFFQNALNGSDQLRQRVAWALSQIFVISGMKDPDLETGYVQARYQNMLAQEAFGNVETLLTKVTLSPAMGHMLDMVDNAKADPKEMTEPNENYARELLQLFSIGTRELKPDGTPLTDAAGAPIPTYGQAEVRAFARALTGWTYPKFDAAQARGNDDDRYYAKDMVSVPDRHDMNSKKLLRGIELPAGQTPEADLAASVRNVFLHPNVGPFLGTQLIHQLVTGNPSPAYVARVTAAFENNGQGVRGDMKAILRAILLDPEARNAPVDNPDYGRFKEPALYATGLLRSLGVGSDGIGLDDVVKSMGQNIFYAPTVFNYFPADYKVPGTDLTAPPMGIHNTNTVLARSNFVQQLLYEGGLDRDDEVAGATGTKLDIRAYAALAGDARKLVTEIDNRLFGGGMPPNMRNEIYLAVQAIDAGDTKERARTALYLAATAFQYQVSR
ncbi:MAG TPA: DUF1800 family protein [Casimicrobiaceae bacterium]|nr:DUF1800 family protein [Casimicrobiaceae bacterium]